MIYRGRALNPISLWSTLGVDFPVGMQSEGAFLPKVVCPNPEHATHKRHFQINVRKPMVHCFANCGISGGLEHAVCVTLGIYKARGITDPSKLTEKVKQAHKEARKTILGHTRLANKEDIGNIDISGQLGYRKTFNTDSAVANDLVRLENGDFTYLPKNVRAYLDERGIDSSSRGKWKIGYDEEEERIIIPAYDMRGTFRFLIKRKIKDGGSLKYLYTDGAVKTSLLFGGCYLDRDQVRSHGLILTEGSLDVIRLHQMGFTNAVAILGTGLSTRQVRIIYDSDARRIYDLFDKDSSGFDNIVDTRKKIVKVPVLVCRYPSGKDDPAELTTSQVQRSMDRAVPVSKFLANVFPKRKVAA